MLKIQTERPQIRTTIIAVFVALTCTYGVLGQKVIPFTPENWKIEAQGHVFENYKGYDAVYIQQGRATLKNTKFLNGTIEFDVFLTERQSFPGIYFRQFDEGNMEGFYLRPHLPGKPDANQAISDMNGVSAWQLYFGPAYSFPYKYNYDDWTHVKLVVNGSRAQVYLDHSAKPNLSWNLKHPTKEGDVSIGGTFAPMHYANFRLDPSAAEIVDFKVIGKGPAPGIIPEWDVSDKFDEKLLGDPANIKQVIAARKWGDKIRIEENSAANISSVRALNAPGGNTVFTRLIIESDRDQIKLLEFGYSDRAVAILNGNPIYRGTNNYRSRDYRYLGTIGLFDAVYLNLKKGENIFLLAVSEDFGGWGVTGKFENTDGIRLK